MANNLMAMFRPQEVYTPVDAMQEVGNARNALASGQLKTMQANALGQEMQNDQAINDVMSQNGGDLQRAYQDPNLNWKAKQQIGGMMADQSKAQADAESKRVDSEMKKWQYAGNLVGTAQNQDEWTRSREQLRGVLGDEFVQHLPEQYSPETAQRYGDAAMTHAEKLALQREERMANYQNQQLSLQERRLQAAENRDAGGGDKWSYSKDLGGMVNSQGVVRPVVDQSGQPIHQGSDESYSKKPLPTTALKLQQEAADSIGISGGTNADLSTLVKNIDDGKLKFGTWQNIKDKAGSKVDLLATDESNAKSQFLATLEKLRNDSLRLNKGVQTDGDAQRAWNELFENINNEKFVRQRLVDIQAINDRGAKLQQMNIDNIRQNYNAPPLDVYGQRFNQDSALGGQQPNTLPQGVTEDDIKETMRARGMTREQVLSKLQGRM